MTKVINSCRVCKREELTSIMVLKNQALTGVFPKSVTDQVTTGDVEMVKCSSQDGCGLVQLRQSYDLDEMYGLNYGYRTGLNSSMVKHIQSKMHTIISSDILNEGDLVIDIGSNDSTGLQAYPKDKYELVGIDPTGIKFSSHYPSHIDLIPEFFSKKAVQAKYGDTKAKVITSFSMFYDLEDPIEFASEIMSVLHEDGIWVFEQSYLPTMIKTNSFDTICHEHIDFYCLKQIDYITKKSGLKIIDVEFNDINGGSFSVTAAKQGSKIRANQEKINSILKREEEDGFDGMNIYIDFKDRVEKAGLDLLNFLERAKDSGKTVCGLGASTKGNVLLQYFDIDSNLIKMVGDVNEDKFGSYTPGSHIPIVSEDEVLSSDPDYLLVLPWHFRSFFENNKKMVGRKLIFPLPNFNIVEL